MPKSRTPLDCPVCSKTISRKSDMARHMKIHAENKQELMHACPVEGCEYKALQKSNLTTHLNQHLGQRPHKCPAEGCDFCTSDPGCLTRHRINMHGYEPRGNSRSHPSGAARKEARRRRRVSPYMSSSSSSTPGTSTRSTSPSVSSVEAPRTPPLQVPFWMDEGLLASMSVASASEHQRSAKNAHAAYSTELISKLTEFSSVNEDEAQPQGADLSFESMRMKLPAGTDKALEDFLAQLDEFVLEPPTVVTDKALEDFIAGLDEFAFEPQAFLPAHENPYAVHNVPYGYHPSESPVPQQCSFLDMLYDSVPPPVDETYFCTSDIMNPDELIMQWLRDC